MELIVFFLNLYIQSLHSIGTFIFLTRIRISCTKHSFRSTAGFGLQDQQVFTTLTATTATSNKSKHKRTTFFSSSSHSEFTRRDMPTFRQTSWISNNKNYHPHTYTHPHKQTGGNREKDRCSNLSYIFRRDGWKGNVRVQLMTRFFI